MSAKNIFTAVLLLFLAAAVGALVFKHLRQNREFSAAFPVASTASENGEKVIVYYFHTQERCDNCRNIETLTLEAVQSGFREPLAAGSLEWRVVDFDEPAQRHFDKDFELGGIPSVVLVRVKGGVPVEWKNLPKIWELITGETKPKFVGYIQKEIRDFSPAFGGKEIPVMEKEIVNKPQTYLFGLLWALWLGIFTSITPCTLATNIAAVAYVGKRAGSPRRVIAAGMIYMLGQTLAYAVLGFVLVAGLLASKTVSSFLHQYMNELLGPLFVLTAMFLLGWVDLGISGPAVSKRLQNRADTWGIWGAFLLGVFFAWTFCPVSGGLFFLQLVPQAVYLDSRIAMPALYGFGNAVPVVVFAFLIAMSAQSLGKAFNCLTQIERWLRWLTGGIFLAVGIYFTLRYIFGL